MKDWVSILGSIMVGGGAGVWIVRRLKRDAYRNRLLDLLGGFQDELGRVRTELGDVETLGTHPTPRLHEHLHAAVEQTLEVDRETLPWLIELDQHLQALQAANAHRDAQALAQMKISWTLATEHLNQIDRSLEASVAKVERA